MSAMQDILSLLHKASPKEVMENADPTTFEPLYFITYEEKNFMNVLIDWHRRNAHSEYPNYDGVTPHYQTGDPLPHIAGYETANADKIDRGVPFAYVEEIRRGEYKKVGSYAKFKSKVTQFQVWFGRVVDFETSAKEREVIREQIENEIVKPFINYYEQAFPTYDVTFEWYTPPSRFDENEVSIMLQFNHTSVSCEWQFVN